MSSVTDFFNRQHSTDTYKSIKKLTHAQDRRAAELLNNAVAGSVLSVGGIWEYFDWKHQVKELTILDLSPDMLKTYAPPGSKAIVGDLFTHEFAPQSFDAVVYPLMLHHVAEGGWRHTEARVAEAVARARRWLRPGGKLYILEYCPHRAWYPVQRGLLPATRGLLAFFKQSMVVMHTVGFFEKLLGQGFTAVQTIAIETPGVSPWAMFPVFLGVPFLKVPVGVYPKMYVFMATRV